MIIVNSLRRKPMTTSKPIHRLLPNVPQCHRGLFHSYLGSRLLWPPYTIGQAIIFCPVVSISFFLSSFYLA